MLYLLEVPHCSIINIMVRLGPILLVMVFKILGMHLSNNYMTETASACIKSQF